MLIQLTIVFYSFQSNFFEATHLQILMLGLNICSSSPWGSEACWPPVQLPGGCYASAIRQQLSVFTHSSVSSSETDEGRATLSHHVMGNEMGRVVGGVRGSQSRLKKSQTNVSVRRLGERLPGPATGG